jgi:PhnB protein
MKTLVPYLTFAGNCREAFEFYRDTLRGEIKSIQTFEEAKMEVEEQSKKKIVHAEFKAGDIYFMASDGMADFTANPGNNISLSINLDDFNELDRIFSGLAAGGKVTMPLQDAFWGARFGMLTDRFGIQWMLSCRKQ